MGSMSASMEILCLEININTCYHMTKGKSKMFIFAAFVIKEVLLKKILRKSLKSLYSVSLFILKTTHVMSN